MQHVRKIYDHNFSIRNCVLRTLDHLLKISDCEKVDKFVTDTLSTPTITEPPSVECQDLLIQTEILFSAITNCASTVSLAPTRLPWPRRLLSEGYDSCTRSCCRGSNWVPSDYQSDALTTRLSAPLILC